ncbi:unnamed protein product [Somion occarium]|uniref:C2H2-type domain-containing protein n=1 Tax=Somion occarium TaxID=3059160 RepID=A0ABP1D1N2_9APHY
MTWHVQPNFSQEWITKHSKQMLTEFYCGWIQCNTHLNSWHVRRQHLLDHCKRSVNPDTGHFYCQMEHCSSYDYLSLHDLQDHMETAHLAQARLPCPVSGCWSSISSEKALVDHFNNVHLKSNNLQFLLLAPTSLPSPASFLQHPQPPLPSSIPSWKVTSPLVNPNCKYTPSQSQPTASQGKRHIWKHMQHVTEMPEEDEEEEPLHTTVAPIEPYLSTPFTQYIIQPTNPLDKDTSLSCHAPLPPASISPPPSPPPIPTMGYSIFTAKYEQLELAGLLDGSGVWVQDPVDHPDSGHEQETM